VLLLKLKYSSNRQDTKNAKKSILTPRYALGGFRKDLAIFANLAVQKTTLNRETISISKRGKFRNEKVTLKVINPK
jgi:hypothetical protein